MKPSAILVAESDDETRDYLSELMRVEFPSARCLVLPGLRDALIVSTEQIFDLIVAEAENEELSGSQFAEEIRLRHGPNQTVPVILVCGNVDETRRDCESLGVKAFYVARKVEILGLADFIRGI